MCKALKALLWFCIMMLGLFCSSQTVTASSIAFEGDGSIKNPYLINSFDDLKQLRDMVNDGNKFTGVYFKQTQDIDMENQLWIPIGVAEQGNYFWGIYDGNGHTIKNINISGEDAFDKSGLFGMVGGTVVNLGIDSGNILGENCGSIAYSSIGSSAKIINCYNQANVSGTYVGGIAYYFPEGTIAACWNTGNLTGSNVGGIVSVGGDVKIYGCYTTHDIVAPPDVSSTTSYSVNESYIYSEAFANRFSMYSALSQYLFCDYFDLTLKQWEIQDGKLSYSDNSGWIVFWGFINSYLLPVLLIIFCVCFIFKLIHLEKGRRWEFVENKIKTVLILSGIMSIFLDSALIYKGVNVLNLGNTCFIMLINSIFLCCLIVIIKHASLTGLKNIKRHVWILCGIIIIVTLELLQFDVVPKYDACLYYGSFTKSIDLFNLDFITFIGAFVCWKWIQGIALFAAPFECLFPRSMISIYIANVLITIITMICLYWLLRRLFINLSNKVAAVLCVVFMVSPYVLGLFTYFCMDWHLAFFTVWLLCSLKKKNNIMISFCGFLLSFTKITGLIFYVFILSTVACLEIFKGNRRMSLWKKICSWWEWRKVVLWIMPAVAYLISLLYGDHFTIQNFYGTYVSESMIDFGNTQRFMNTFLQTFVFGFRWAFVAVTIISAIIYIFNKQKIKFVQKDSINLYIGIVVAFVATFCVLCVYNADADCPRYTAIFSLFYIMLLPLFLTLFTKERFKFIVSLGICLILLIQTYWTVDPMIMLFSDSIDSGKKQIYKLVLPGDERPGMNIGVSYAGLEVMCDLFTYNFEYTYYDDLLEDIFLRIDPKVTDQFYVLDIIDYELHVSGSANRNYKIYWNSRLKQRTYDNEDQDSIYLSVGSLKTADLCSMSIGDIVLPDSFYLLVVARVDETDALERLEQENYKITYEMHPENIYGSMSVYKLEKESN